MIRVTLPTHLRALAKVNGAVMLEVAEPVTQRAILDALEAAYPMLRGTVRDTTTKERRPFIRFFACGEDLSHEAADALVPPDVASGNEPYRIIGAMAGG
jgi:hypothetical protein